VPLLVVGQVTQEGAGVGVGEVPAHLECRDQMTCFRGPNKNRLRVLPPR